MYLLGMVENLVTECFAYMATDTLKADLDLPPDRYKNHHKIENSFARLKDWRRVATRYDRCPKALLSACALAAVVMFLL